jgi:hypothetical protein
MIFAITCLSVTYKNLKLNLKICKNLVQKCFCFMKPVLMFYV